MVLRIEIEYYNKIYFFSSSVSISIFFASDLLRSVLSGSSACIIETGMKVSMQIFVSPDLEIMAGTGTDRMEVGWEVEVSKA